MTSRDELPGARLEELWRQSNVRNRKADREPRTVTITDDEMRVLLVTLTDMAKQLDQENEDG